MSTILTFKGLEFSCITGLELRSVEHKNDTGFAPWRVRPHYKISISSLPPTFSSFFASNNLTTQWIKEQRTISICDSIWLGVNLIKLT